MSSTAETWTRRQLLTGAAAGLVSATAARAADPKRRLPICAFSKHFQWTHPEDAIEIIASLGYDGVDLTVRPRGHVEPQRVADELPRFVESIRKAGLAVPMITSGIRDMETPYAEKVIETIAGLGIRHYRWGGFRYDADRPIPEQLAEIKPRIRELAAVNEQYGVCAMYHTHSGENQVGASFWDLYGLLKDSDPDAVSVNFDVGHATIEGGLGGWVHSTRLLLPFTRGVAVKDFIWEKNAEGRWERRWRPLGEGMVDFGRFFGMLKAAAFSGPLQLHMEYHELGGADRGRSELTAPRERVLELMRRDVDVLKRMLRDAELA